MRVTILTCLPRGVAANCLRELCRSDAVELVGVIVAATGIPNRRRYYVRKFKKIARIGPLGALNGIRMRPWYDDPDAEDVREVARELGVPVFGTPLVNSEDTRRLFREARTELGLSLGNDYIGPRTFSTPQYGMVNNHMEVLPRFRGAQSVIWPIHEDVSETGFTIHQIDAHIDTGVILHQERFPIRFASTLRETVEQSLAEIRSRVPGGLRDVCERYHELRKQAQPQGTGSSFTTPTFRQYLRMRSNHARMARRGHVSATAGD